jgi:uncharacterized membrane protein YhaH (DUF805 family)
MDLVRLCFSFFGRVNRAKYWIGVGIAFGMMWLGTLVFFSIEPESVYWDTALGLWVSLWIVALLAVVEKRLHDLDISGWWLLGFMIVYGFLVVPRHQMLNTIGNVALAFAIIWLGSTRGTEGSNRFGPDPIFRLASRHVAKWENYARSTLMRWGRIALWVLALLPSVTLALLTVQLLANLDAPWPTGYSVWSAEILIPAGTLLISTVGAISIWLAWRKERRDSREYTLKMQQLEMQVAELRATKNSSSTPPVAP